MTEDIVTRLRDAAGEMSPGAFLPDDGPLLTEAADEIERLIVIIKNLRTLGDRLYVHLDAQFGIMNPAPYEIDKSIFLWREFRHDS